MEKVAALGETQAWARDAARGSDSRRSPNYVVAAVFARGALELILVLRCETTGCPDNRVKCVF